VSIKLSIIIPIFNSEKYLAECLNSICPQIKKNVEVILVNDCSTDKSNAICKSFIKKFNFIKLITLKKNRGVSYCRNIGINLASGKYLCFVDSDDKLIKGAINILLKNIRLNLENEVFIIKNLVLKNKKNSKAVDDKNQIFKNSNKKNLSIFDFTKNLNEFRATCWNFVLKKDFLYFNNIFFKNIKVAEDWVFVSEILCLAKNFKMIKKPVYIHRMYEPNTLGKKIGYIFVMSRIKVICEISKLFNLNKSFFGQEKINYLIRILKLATQEMYSSIIICNHNEIKKINKYIKKNKALIMKPPYYNLKNFHLLKYKLKKDIFIKKIISKLKNNKIILFCAGSYGRITLKYLSKLGIKVKIIIDNNTQFSGKKIGSAKIVSPIYLKENLKKFSNYKIFVCNKLTNDFNSVKLQLLKIGIKEKNILHFNKI